MKITLMFILVGIIQASASTYAQEHRITLSIENGTFYDVVSQIEKQSEFMFFYKSEEIDNTQKINLHVKDKLISEVLNEIMKNSNLTYKVMGKHIVIMKSKDTAPVSQQQVNQITGVVVDERGVSIIGANVVEKGTINGTITDEHGRFSLNVAPDAILIVSFLGYKSEEIPVRDNTHLTIRLIEDWQSLEEVVVVGFGSQKKSSLTGSVATIDAEKITESRPVTNAGQLLLNGAAGINASSSTNEPGEASISIELRGVGSLNGGSPLIIIDGVEANINSVLPQDIESMSILKDASAAAIYGSRAANGIILITTKKGKSGSLKIDYNGYVSFESANLTNAIQPVSNYADYMELLNEGYLNTGMNPIYSQEKIDEWRAAGNSDPLKYPNNNWLDQLFNTGVTHNHTISMHGGSEKIRFYASFGYNNNPGVMDNSGSERYMGRLNVEADIKPWLTLGASINGSIKWIDRGDVSSAFSYGMGTTPGMVFQSSDGRLGAANNEEDGAVYSNNPIKQLWSQIGEYRQTNVRPIFNMVFKPFNGFSITGTYSYDFQDYFQSTKPQYFDFWNFYTNEIAASDVGSRNYIRNYNRNIIRAYGDIVARYETKFFEDRLNMSAMVGASQEEYSDQVFQVERYDLTDESNNTMSSATGDISTSGTYEAWAMRSFFGRINLDWENKYLAEVNLRVDQSSRFTAQNRTGYFPSGSIGWRMDQEDFMEDWREKGLSNLKVRASYGALGNNSVGNYATISNYEISNYVLNSVPVVGLVQTSLANQLLTWETTYTADAGVDFGVLNNRLTGTVDYYHRKTKGILISLPAPLTNGTVGIPDQNSAEVQNQGLELTLGWSDQIGDFTYGLTGSFTYNKNLVTKFKGDEYSLSEANLTQEGYPINAQYMLVVDRIIQTDEDLAIVNQMLADNPNAFDAYGVPEKGDLLYKDINGDGIIDSNDRTVVSDGPIPKYLFGLTANAAWKGLDFSITFQGKAGTHSYWQSNGYNTPTVRQGFQLNAAVAEGRWYEGRTDATYPRLLYISNATVNTQISDFYLENLAYLKIRNISLGYTLPKAWTNKMQIERIRIYGSLENFFTFTQYRGLDPEVSGAAYPTMKEVLVGLNVTF